MHNFLFSFNAGPLPKCLAVMSGWAKAPYLWGRSPFTCQPQHVASDFRVTLHITWLFVKLLSL